MPLFFFMLIFSSDTPMMAFAITRRHRRRAASPPSPLLFFRYHVTPITYAITAIYAILILFCRFFVDFSPPLIFAACYAIF